MQQIRATATRPSSRRPPVQTSPARAAKSGATSDATAERAPGRKSQRATGGGLQRKALRWAIDNRGADGRLPSGKAIADQFGRHERWGRLVKHHGDAAEPGGRMQGSAA
jgi:hypothetical protein